MLLEQRNYSKTYSKYIENLKKFAIKNRRTDTHFFLRSCYPTLLIIAHHLRYITFNTWYICTLKHFKIKGNIMLSV